MTLRPRLALLVLVLLLASCAGQNTRETGQQKTAAGLSWAQHSDRMQQLQQWTASGKLALRSSTQAESASILWQQQGRNSQLQLSGPMGLSATTISSDGRQVEIRQGDELSTLDISTPDAIALSTGWDLPLQALPYWLKGTPSPDSTIQQLELDPETDLLRHLKQDDWEVLYERYKRFNDFMLPTHLRIQRGTTSARVIIREWQVQPD